MKTYYTKCGKVAFQKSSTASVTRFEDINEHCEGCLFIQQSTTYRGGLEVPITFCQAGSKEPNHRTEYSTTNENDATTLSILSLDMKLLKEIHEYASSLEGCLRSYESWPKVFHGMDRDDCRKSMPLGFESNKKGKAAKKSIIEKFFKEAMDPEEDCDHCEDCKHSVDEGESVEYIKCSNKKRFVMKKQKACDKFEPWEKHLCIECLFCRRSEKAADHPTPYKCFRAAHRNGQDWYFALDSIACSNFNPCSVSCSNCKTDRATCGAMYPSDYMYKDMKPCNMYTSQLLQKKYVDDKNRLIFVSSGLGGVNYMTMYRDQGWVDKDYGMHRLKSQSLPTRNTPEEAQADLDAYAAKKGWKGYEDEEKSTPACDRGRCPFHACMSDHCQLEHVIENAPHTVREMVDKVIEYCPNTERLVNSMGMGCGPVENIKCRINDHGWCRLETASFADMDAEAEHCGFIRVNERYLVEKYGVTLKDFICGNCSSFTHTKTTTTKGTCSECNEERYEGAYACYSNFTKKEVGTKLKCTKHHCPFNDDMNSECGFNPITDDAHRPQMEEALDEYKCTNSELLKVLREIESMDKTCEGCCYLHKSEICNNTNNQRRATPDTPRCGWYWNVKTGEMGAEQQKESYPDGECENLESKVKMELVKPEERYIEDTTQDPVAAFDYSTVDTDTATFLQEKEQKITQIRMMSVMAIGKELKEVHEKLANNKTGTFMTWCKSIGISWDTANNYMRAFNYISENFGHIEDAEKIQPSLLFAISKPSAPAELQEKVLSGDITSHKQYKELEDKLKAEKERADSAERREKAREQEKAWEEQKARDNYKAAQEAQKRAEQAEKALQQLSKAHAVSPGEVEKLKKELEEANKQVEKFKEEANQPVNLAPAVVHETPPEVQEELEQLRAQVDINRDYGYIADALSKLIVLKPGMIDNWVAVAQNNASTYELGQMLGNLGDVKTTIGTMMSKLQDILANK